MVDKVDTELIEKMIQDLSKDIQDIRSKNEDPNDYINTLQKKYKYLYKIIPTIFTVILKERPEFNDNIQMILKYIKQIQEKKVSQDTASKHVGSVLAKQFFPK